MGHPLYDPIDGPRAIAGEPTRIVVAEVAVTNADGTVDVRSTQGRAAKFRVPVVELPVAPTRGSLVLVCDLDGDPQRPCVLAVLRRA